MSKHNLTKCDKCKANLNIDGFVLPPHKIIHSVEGVDLCQSCAEKTNVADIDELKKNRKQ